MKTDSIFYRLFQEFPGIFFELIGGLPDEAIKRNFIDLVETILVYKLPNKTWEEVKAMFGLEELKQTKVFQEAQQTTKLELIPSLIKEGLSIEQIARVLQLPVEVVQQEAQKA